MVFRFLGKRFGGLWLSSSLSHVRYKQTLTLNTSHHFFLMRKVIGLPQPCLPWFLCCGSGHGAMEKVPLPDSISPPSFGVTAAPSPPPGHKGSIQLLQL